MATQPPPPLTERTPERADAQDRSDAQDRCNKKDRPGALPKTAWHYLDPYIQRQNDLRVLLVGCGGNGARMLLRLATLHRALRELGGKILKVAVYDGDVVSEPNLVRQPFAPADVGQPKAVVLTHRVNMTFGTGFQARPEHLTEETAPTHRRNIPHLVISCVDSRAARAAVQSVIERWAGDGQGVAETPRYWLDLGNSYASGQYLLGTVGQAASKAAKSAGADSNVAGGAAAKNALETNAKLPTAPEKWPEIVDAALDEDDEPSCSSREALERQDLFVNDVLAAEAAGLLWRLLRGGRISFHGAFCNLQTGRSAPIRVPPA